MRVRPVLFLVVLVVPLLAAAVGAARAEAIVFSARAAYTAGSQPRAVAVGDVNADGKLDVVAANMGSGTVSLYKGTGLGTFGVKTDSATASLPRAVVCADFNRDGRKDVLTANWNAGANTASLLLANSSGGLGPRINIPVGVNSTSIATGDVNNDGKLDFVIANEGPLSGANGHLSVRLGNGAGGFTAAANVTTRAFPFGVAMADFTGDGRQDLVVANWTGNSMTLFRGSGTGGFTRVAEFATGASPFALAAADVNNDGRQDAVVANSGENTVSVLLGNGAGGFAPKRDYAVGAYPNAVVVADLTGDGKLDVAASCYNGSVFSVLTGDGLGGLGSRLDVRTGTNPSGLALGLFNADTKLDVATSDLGANQVGVYLQR